MSLLSEELRDVTGRLHRAWARERGTRVRLLRFHAWKCIVVGVLISLGGAAPSMETQIGSWARPVLAALGVAAGLLLLAGVARPRGSGLLVVGLALVGFWDLLLAFGFILAAVLYAQTQTIAVRAPWDLTPLPPGQPVLYAPAIYFALVGLVWSIHLVAVIEEQRSGDVDV